MTSTRATLAVVALLLALTGCSGDGSPDAERQTNTPAAPTSAAAESTTAGPAPVSPAPTYQDGIYAVGTEIQPGTYSTTAGDRPCYWARLRSFGQPNSIIDDHNVEPGESARVVVQPSDRGFKVSNGCTWRRELPL